LHSFRIFNRVKLVFQTIFYLPLLYNIFLKRKRKRSFLKNKTDCYFFVHSLKDVFKNKKPGKSSRLFIIFLVLFIRFPCIIFTIYIR
jgi:hypothetical protein